MILIDTNILVDYWNGNLPDFAEKIKNQEIAICGAIESEILTGAKTEKEFKELKEFFCDFNFFPMEDNDWILLGKMLMILRSKGLKVPFPDAIISYLAIKTNSTVWSNDKHFPLIQSVLPQLKLL